jgi:hypothetical protein
MPTPAAAAAAVATVEEVWPFSRDEFHVSASLSRPPLPSLPIWQPMGGYSPMGPLCKPPAFLTIEESNCTLCVASRSADCRPCVDVFVALQVAATVVAAAVVVAAAATGEMTAEEEEEGATIAVAVVVAEGEGEGGMGEMIVVEEGAMEGETTAEEVVGAMEGEIVMTTAGAGAGAAGAVEETVMIAAVVEGGTVTEETVTIATAIIRAALGTGMRRRPCSWILFAVSTWSHLSESAARSVCLSGAAPLHRRCIGKFLFFPILGKTLTFRNTRVCACSRLRKRNGGRERREGRGGGGGRGYGD